MKLALLLPGYLDSPDYNHLVVIDNHLKDLGYTTIRVDACNLWKTNDIKNYTFTNYLSQVKNILGKYPSSKIDEVVFVGHSLRCYIALISANNIDLTSKIVCINIPNPKSTPNNKWSGGVRHSVRDLPNSSSTTREFEIPVSFLNDQLKYNFFESIKSNKKPLQIIMGEGDPSFTEVEAIAKELKLPHFIKIKGMGHDFRQSDHFCSQVATEIEKFLTL